MLALLETSSLLVAYPLQAQQQVPPLLSVHLECRVSHCERAYFRERIDGIDFVATVRDADVVATIAPMETAAARLLFRIEFRGRASFAGLDDELVYTADTAVASDSVGEGLVRTFRRGLERYATATLARQEGQESEAPDRIHVFIDCSDVYCPRDHFQREIRFVAYVRQPQDAEVHVLITGGRTGAGGRRFDLRFIGRKAFDGLEGQLRFASSATATDVEVRDGISRKLKAGLLWYVARTPSLENVRIEYQPSAGESGARRAADDPWNRWVFRTSFSGSFSGEERSDFLSLSASQSISRVTEQMKFGLDFGGSYFESNFEVNDSTTVTSVTRAYEAELLYVASVGSHWGMGFRASARHSTFRNYELSARFAPAIEFNVFPYDESTRRQFRILYAAGVRRFDYEKETIFFQTEETLFDQSLTVSMDINEVWGAADFGVEGSHFLDDIGKNRIEGFAHFNIRIVKGLGLSLGGSATRVRDQINLPRGDATEEEVLLRQRELKTDFRLQATFGLNITFGSVFSDVVNPRFGG